MARRTKSISMATFGSLMLVSGLAFGGPPEAADDDNPDAPTIPAAATPTGNPDSFRQQMEKSLGELEDLAEDAKQSDDLAQAACVFDKRDRAADVMELGTSELLIIRDPNTEDQMREFATGKLGAAARRMDTLLEEARACGDEVGKSKEELARNKAKQPSDVPMGDPSAGTGDPKVPPPVEGSWPPTASATE
jgi:hypothetical protein